MIAHLLLSRPQIHRGGSTVTHTVALRLWPLGDAHLPKLIPDMVPGAFCPSEGSGNLWELWTRLIAPLSKDQLRHWLHLPSMLHWPLSPLGHVRFWLA